MALFEKPHNEDDIDQLRAVADGKLIGHLFISELDAPTIIFQDPAVEDFPPALITSTERLLTELYVDPVVYDGVLYSEVARVRAIEMMLENARA